MMTPIDTTTAAAAVSNLRAPAATPAANAFATPTVAPGFEAQVIDAISAVEAQHVKADGVLSDLASGRNVDLHNTMIELEKADIALRTMVSVRDRFISAYEQVMNMTV